MSQTSVGVDFTLETVQYKFATIIGELCGKPSILSQFAVWLDLRLSEYKLKGSISLDCSGLKPDPDWLQGLKDSTPPWSPHQLCDQPGQPTQRRQRQRSGQRARHSTDVAPPSHVVIKEEGRDLELDFPVSSDCLNNSSSQFHGQIKRKRSFHDTNTSLSLPGRIEQTGIYKNRSGAPLHGRIERTHHSLAKQKLPSKSSSPGSSDITSLNNFCESTVLPNQENSPNQTSSFSDLNTNSQSIRPDNAISAYTRGNNSADCSSTVTVTSEAFAEDSVSEPSLQRVLNIQSPLADEQSGMSTEAGMPNTDLREDSVSRTDALGGSCTDSQRVGDMNGALQNCWSGRHRVSTLAMAYGCSRNTLSNVCASVTSFERWLRENSSDINSVVEARKMFEIPPPDLDMLLVDFFKTVKKPNGEDYNPGSLRSLRTNLARYLKENMYPYSIVTAEVFANSQLAFKNRMRALESRLSS